MSSAGIGGGRFQGFPEPIGSAPGSTSTPIPLPNPVPMKGFPGGKAKPSGGIGGQGFLNNGPLTPDVIERITADSHPTDRITLRPLEWKKIPVDRPTIAWIVPSDSNETPGLANVPQAFFWYNYGVKPTVATITDCQYSEHGVALLSGRGDWWIRQTNSTATMDILLFDAFNPSVAAKWLSQTGPGFTSESNLNVSGPNTTQTLAGTNRYRIGLTIQNVKPAATAGSTMRISIGQPPTYLVSGGAWQGTGIQLALGASITFSGDTLSRGAVYATLEAVTAGGSQAEVIEYSSAV